MTKVFVLDPNYNGKSKQAISCANCTNQKEIRFALKLYRENYTDVVQYSTVQEVLNGGIFGYVRGQNICIVIGD